MSLKIAFYAPMKPPDHETPSGDRTVGRLLITALQCAGHSVHVVSRFRSWAATPEQQARLRERTPRERDRAKAMLTHVRPDIWLTYHLSYKAPDWLGPALCARARLPYLITEASDSPAQAAGPWRSGVTDVRKALDAAQAVFLMKNRDRPALEQLPGVAPKLIYLPPFTDGADRPHLACGKRAGPVRLLTVAMMRPGAKLESYRLLAAALHHVPGPWRLDIAGDGPGRNEVEVLFSPFGARVAFTGALEGMALQALYHDADLFVWPDIGEAIGMVYLEAQAAGLSVVACDTAGVPEVVQNGGTGFLHTGTNPRAFAETLFRLMARAEMRTRMGRAATERIRARHGIDHAATILNRTLMTMRTPA